MGKRQKQPRPENGPRISSVEQYLQTLKQPLPAWLQRSLEQLTFSSGNLFSLLTERNLYYAGAGQDGLPLKAFARSNAAHGFIYSDYWKENYSPIGVQRLLQPTHQDLDRYWNPAIRGYWPVVNEVIHPLTFYETISEMLSQYDYPSRDKAHAPLQSLGDAGNLAGVGGLSYGASSIFHHHEEFVGEHGAFQVSLLDPLVDPQRHQQVEDSFKLQFSRTMAKLLKRSPRLLDHEHQNLQSRPRFPWRGPSFSGAVWAILERDHRLDDRHGPSRVAHLFLSADSYWCYWLLYGLLGIPPFVLVLQDHGYGGNYSVFGSNRSPLLSLTQLTGLPPWVLRATSGTDAWPGYRTLPGTVGPSESGHLRSLEEKARDLLWE